MKTRSKMTAWIRKERWKDYFKVGEMKDKKRKAIKKTEWKWNEKKALNWSKIRADGVGGG